MRVKVFRDHPIWGVADHWWKLPVETLLHLHIQSYDLATDEDGDVIHYDRQMTWIYQQHPHCVFVYLKPLS